MSQTPPKINAQHQEWAVADTKKVIESCERILANRLYCGDPVIPELLSAVKILAYRVEMLETASGASQ